MISIESLIKIFGDDTVIMTKHSKNRCFERNIFFDDIKNAVMDGEIIEQYEDDMPFPSCLILGRSSLGKPIHVVLSTDGNYIYIITAYYPDELKWRDDYKVRRRNNNEML